MRSALATIKCGNINFPRYFMAVRKFTNKSISKYFRTSVWVTRSSMLDCHVLKRFGIYMIGILDRLY